MAAVYTLRSLLAPYEFCPKKCLQSMGNIQKIKDGEPLGGKTSAADDFSTLADDDFLA